MMTISGLTDHQSKRTDSEAAAAASERKMLSFD
jgi:hypothetical protein